MNQSMVKYNCSGRVAEVRIISTTAPEQLQQMKGKRL